VHHGFVAARASRRACLLASFKSFSAVAMYGNFLFRRFRRREYSRVSPLFFTASSRKAVQLELVRPLRSVRQMGDRHTFHRLDEIDRCQWFFPLACHITFPATVGFVGSPEGPKTSGSESQAAKSAMERIAASRDICLRSGWAVVSTGLIR
jgi:hypothetical protein